MKRSRNSYPFLAPFSMNWQVALSRRVAIFEGPGVSAASALSCVLRAWGYHISSINSGQCERGELDGCAAIYMPGGASAKLSAKCIRNLKRFILNGGGYVGICNGAHVAIRLGLLKVKRYIIVRGKGTMQVRIVARHPITRDLDLVPRSPERKGLDPVPHSNVGRVKMDWGNGVWMVAGKRTQALATFDNDDIYAAVAAGHYGKGRVAVFSGHPQYTVAFRSGPTARKYNTDAQANMRMVFRAFEYVSRADGGISRVPSNPSRASA